MNKLLQEKLYRKYPALFIQKDLPMTQTCMCWGCDCGDGWYDILEELCEKVKDVPDLQFAQVKEKFGGLRVYPEPGNVAASDMKRVYADIVEATKESYATCEYCGDPGELDTKRAWHRTLCPTCRLH